MKLQNLNEVQILEQDRIGLKEFLLKIGVTDRINMIVDAKDIDYIFSSYLSHEEADFLRGMIKRRIKNVETKLISLGVEL